METLKGVHRPRHRPRTAGPKWQVGHLYADPASDRSGKAVAAALPAPAQPDKSKTYQASKTDPIVPAASPPKVNPTKADTAHDYGEVVDPSESEEFSAGSSAATHFHRPTAPSSTRRSSASSAKPLSLLNPQRRIADAATSASITAASAACEAPKAAKSSDAAPTS